MCAIEELIILIIIILETDVLGLYIAYWIPQKLKKIKWISSQQTRGIDPMLSSTSAQH